MEAAVGHLVDDGLPRLIGLAQAEGEVRERQLPLYLRGGALLLDRAWQAGDAEYFYVSRRNGGWCEGWGWGVDEAIASLARAIEGQPSGQLPVEAPVERQRLVAWLTEATPAPILAP